MAESFYYQANGQTIGPLTPAGLKQLANEGVIVESTLVRRGEQGAWCPAGTFAGLIPPQRAEFGAAPGPEPDAAERARRTLRMAEEQADKVAAKLWFLDLKFSRFYTPKLVGPLWAIYLCLVVIFFLSSAVYDVLNINLFIAPFAIVVQFIFLSFAVIFTRIILEVVLVIFRVAENLEPLKHLERLKSSPDNEK